MPVRASAGVPAGGHRRGFEEVGAATAPGRRGDLAHRSGVGRQHGHGPAFNQALAVEGPSGPSTVGWPRKDSIRVRISGASGSTCGRKRGTSPAGGTGNFSKFHFTLPALPAASGVLVSSAYKGWRERPFTLIFSNIGKVTP